jgi:hypothetical protein
VEESYHQEEAEEASYFQAEVEEHYHLSSSYHQEEVEVAEASFPQEAEEVEHVPLQNYYSPI